MGTWTQVVDDALRLIGVLQRGENADPYDAQNALRDAGLLLESWDNERLSIYAMRQVTHALTSGTQTYYIGRGGDIKETSGTAQAGTDTTITLASGEITSDHEYNDFVIVLDGGTGSGQYRTIKASVASTDVATVDSDWDTNPNATTTYYIEARRPQRIQAAFTRDANNQDFGINVTLENDEWSRICLKNLAATYPNYLYYRMSYPRGQINLYPSPGSGLTLYLEVWEALTRPGALTSTVSFPPGYERAFVYNLAVELAPRYGVDPPSIVERTAVKSLATLKSLNQRFPKMKLDLPGMRHSSARERFFSGD